MILVNKGINTKEVLTVHGYITYKRTVLIPVDDTSAETLKKITGQKSVIPVDDALGVSNLPFKITYRMMAFIAKEATIASSYAEATERICKGLNDKISISQVGHVTDFVGTLMYKCQEKEANDAKERFKSRFIDQRKIRRRKEEVLYIEVDSMMMYILDKEHYDMDDDEIPDVFKCEKFGLGESRHALCFHADDIKCYYKDSQGNYKSGYFADVLALGADIAVTGYRIENRECIGYIGPSEKFQYHLLALAEREDWEYCSKVVVLSDGAKWVETAKETIFKGRPIVQILNLFHAKENAGKFADWAKRGKSQKKEYAEYLCALIEDGKVDELLTELKPYETVKTPEGIPNLYKYIENNREYMNYPQDRADGLFVGSGTMESENIYMMQNRKPQGMRWLVRNGRHMLCLRSHYASRTWYNVVGCLKQYCRVSD